MGQYYKVIILDNNVIITWFSPSSYRYGIKLMEHSYFNTSLLKTIEYLFSPDGLYYKKQLAWAGDYADKEKDNLNLYNIVNDNKSTCVYNYNYNYHYIVNHTKKLYVVKEKCISNIHPLPLLTSEGNGKGCGDYFGDNKDLCGTWARDSISVENELSKEILENFTELIPNFRE